MIRPGTVIWLMLVIIVGYAMFQVKYEVMQQEDTLASLYKEIADDRDQIRVLDAEWSYLTRPERLKRLAGRYLDLAPFGAAQIVDLSALPERPGAPAALVTVTSAGAAAQPAATRAGEPAAAEVAP